MLPFGGGGPGVVVSGLYVISMVLVRVVRLSVALALHSVGHNFATWPSDMICAVAGGTNIHIVMICWRIIILECYSCSF